MQTAEFVWNNTHIIDNLIKHIEYGPIAECLLKLFCLEGFPSNLINDFLVE